jgi:uncharacterized protein YqgC (DUF456 family)
MYVVWWVLAILLMVAGVVGTFVPAIPGVPLVFAGMLAGAWIDHFTRVGAITLAILGALTVLALAIDFAATVLGAKRAGASRLALIGAAVGTVVGLFFGLPGLLLGPFVGAVVGELMARRSLEDAARVGIATWLGLLVATIARLAILCTMIGIFVLTYLFNGPAHL